MPQIFCHLFILFPIWDRNPVFVFLVVFPLSSYYVPFLSLVQTCLLQGAFRDHSNLDYMPMDPLKSSTTEYNLNHSIYTLGKEIVFLWISRLSAGALQGKTAQQEKGTQKNFFFYMDIEAPHFLWPASGKRVRKPSGIFSIKFLRLKYSTRQGAVQSWTPSQNQI